MTNKDKQDVIAICNILADKMSDSGKVAVQQIIGAVEDMVENEPCEDCISRAEALRHSHIEYDDDGVGHRVVYVEDIEELPSVTPKGVTITDFADKCRECGKILNDKLQTRWIPIKTRPMTEEEKEEIGHEYAYMYDCPLPDDGQDVLITGCYGNVEIDTFYRDPEGFYFETNCDDGEVIAWMPFPEPYKGVK